MILRVECSDALLLGEIVGKVGGLLHFCDEISKLTDRAVVFERVLSLADASKQGHSRGHDDEAEYPGRDGQFNAR